MPYDRDREHFRIPYPMAARPTFRLVGQSFEVVDVSEGGLKFLVGEADPPPVGEMLSGALTLVRGDTVVVTGRVLRVAEGLVVLQLETYLPFRLILEEQRYLRQEGWWFG